MGTSPDVLGPVGRAVLRWSVPMAFAFCALCLIAERVQAYRRILLATEISEAIQRIRPTTLSELKTALGNHILRETAWPSPPEGMELEAVRVRLKPPLWLDLSVEIAPKTERIAKMCFIYAASEEVSVDDPRRDLSGVSWYDWLFIAAITVCPSWLWLRVTRHGRWYEFLRLLGTVVVALFLLYALALAGLCLMRLPAYIF